MKLGSHPDGNMSCLEMSGHRTIWQGNLAIRKSGWGSIVIWQNNLAVIWPSIWSWVGAIWNRAINLAIQYSNLDWELKSGIAIWLGIWLGKSGASWGVVTGPINLELGGMELDNLEW